MVKHVKILSNDENGLCEMEQDFTHLENYYLIKPDAIDMFVGVIISLKDNQLCQKLRKSGYNSVERFSWTNIDLKYIKIYEKLLLH